MTFFNMNFVKWFTKHFWKISKAALQCIYKIGIYLLLVAFSLNKCGILGLLNFSSIFYPSLCCYDQKYLDFMTMWQRDILLSVGPSLHDSWWIKLVLSMITGNPQKKVIKVNYPAWFWLVNCSNINISLVD